MQVTPCCLVLQVYKTHSRIWQPAWYPAEHMLCDGHKTLSLVRWVQCQVRATLLLSARLITRCAPCGPEVSSCASVCLELILVQLQPNVPIARPAQGQKL